MGLDMYLYAEQYVSGWDFNRDPRYDKIVTATGLTPTTHSPHVTVSTCVGYWRKANQIHNWFVQNVQGGRDECQRAYVPREKAQELLDLCQKVLDSRDASLLPQVSGFFFGSTEVDEWYWEDVKETIVTLSHVLSITSESDSLYYQSSW